VADLVQLEVEDGIATIRLNRPPVNVLNMAMQEQIRAAAVEADRRKDVAAVILFGGEKAFAAGVDVKEMAGMSYPEMADRSGVMQAAFTAVAAIAKPTVSAVTGYALGGGCELSLCTDFRVAGEGAKLGQPEILLGIIPGAGGTQRLPRLIGPARAKNLIYTGRFVAADEALAIGLVDAVVPDDQVHAEAKQLMARYTKAPAYALRAAKEAIDRGLDVDLATGLEIERMQFSALFATQDRTIGMNSFIESGPGKATFSNS